MLLLNARSVQYKSKLICNPIVDEKDDLVCITETWMIVEGGLVLSKICPPGDSIQIHGRSQGWGGCVSVVHIISIKVSRISAHLCPGLEYLHLMLDQWDRMEIVLVYLSLLCHNPMLSLPRLTDFILGMLLRSPRFLFLGYFNIHAETHVAGDGWSGWQSGQSLGCPLEFRGDPSSRHDFSQRLSSLWSPICTMVYKRVEGEEAIKKMGSEQMGESCLRMQSRCSQGGDQQIL